MTEMERIKWSKRDREEKMTISQSRSKQGDKPGKSVTKL